MKISITERGHHTLRRIDYFEKSSIHDRASIAKPLITESNVHMHK
jgi:hypothetical protein